MLFGCCSFFVLQRWWRCGICSKHSLRNNGATSHTVLFKSHCRGRQCSLFCLFAPFPHGYTVSRGVPGISHKRSSTLNDLLQATMLRIRATNRTIVGYVRCARFPQMQALASLFACGQPGYRGSHGDAVLRFFKIAIIPHIDDIEKQVEQEVQLVSRLVEMRGFEPRFVLLHPTPSTCLFGD